MEASTITPSEIVIRGKTAPNGLGLWTAAALVQVRTQVQRDIILPVEGVHPTEMEAISAAIRTGTRWLQSHMTIDGTRAESTRA